MWGNPVSASIQNRNSTTDPLSEIHCNQPFTTLEGPEHLSDKSVSPVALSDQLNVEEGDLEGLPDNVVRFRNMPLAEEVAKRAAQVLDV